jgi:signal transduction histidine kinase
MTVPDLREHRDRVRWRLAVGLTVSTLLVAAAIAVGATLIAGWQADDSSEGAQAGAARVGDNVAVVIVADEGTEAAAAQARSDTLRWSLVALALSLLPAIAAGWFAAGRMLGAVDEALTEIEAADEERARSLQDVVHELRTPLAVIGTNLELAASQDATDSFVEAARRAAMRMGRTVDDLAGHGRLAVVADGTRVDLAALSGGVVAEFSGPASARGLGLVAVGERGPIPVDGDAAAMKTALGNLVGNSVRLAPRGSTISVDWGAATGWAWVAVTDEGPGLPPELHSRVFERGWRGRHDRDRIDGSERTGLGLTIARQMVEAQGGVVTLVSDEGGGSTFAIWLPATSDVDHSKILSADGIHPTVLPWLKDSIET